MNKIILDGIDLKDLLDKIGEFIEDKLNKAKSPPLKPNEAVHLSRNFFVSLF